MAVAQSCPTLCDPMDHSQPGSSVHGILQASRKSGNLEVGGASRHSTGFGALEEGLCQSPGHKRRADSGAASGTAASTCRLVASLAHQASNSFCSFTLALSMSSCKCSISTFRAFRRANIVLYLQWNQRRGREGGFERPGRASEARQNGRGARGQSTVLVCEPRAGHFCLAGHGLP